MAFSIDTTSYNKAAKHPVGHGYGTRPGACTSGVVHSTNNSQANTLFENEANYLYNSPDVSAHYLIGKDGRIVQFLDVRKYQAWHAGGKQANGTWTAQPEFANPASFGIELHKSTPDPFYPQIQLDALGWLIKQLSMQFGIAPQMIETHGQIAIAGPYVRKTDPDDWLHADFVSWRNVLFATDPLKAKTLPGLPPTNEPIYCSVGAYNFYNQRGGVKYNGYPLRHMFYDESLKANVLVCERVLIKESAQFGIEQALIQEAQRESWI